MYDPTRYSDLVATLGPEAAGEALRLFLDDTDARLRELNGENGALDLDHVAHQADMIKTAAATFGLVRLSRLARRLEEEAAAAKRIDLPRRVLQLRGAFAMGCSALLDQPAAG